MGIEACLSLQRRAKEGGQSVGWYIEATIQTNEHQGRLKGVHPSIDVLRGWAWSMQWIWGAVIQPERYWWQLRSSTPSGEVLKWESKECPTFYESNNAGQEVLVGIQQCQFRWRSAKKDDINHRIHHRRTNGGSGAVIGIMECLSQKRCVDSWGIETEMTCNGVLPMIVNGHCAVPVIAESHRRGGHIIWPS